MSQVVIWIVALASALLLAAGGFALALARLRARLARSRAQAAQAAHRIAKASADPFGELKVIADELYRLRQRLDRVGQGGGRPPEADLAMAAPGPGTPPPGRGGKANAASSELEADLELFKREVYEKSRQVETLEADKQRLAERVVQLEEQVQRAAARAAERPEGGIPAAAAAARASRDDASADDLAELIDTLQQEADTLRGQLAERDQSLETLEKGDSTGLVHELERIRKELRTRNGEVDRLQDAVSRAEHSAEQARNRTTEIVREKETVAARALESAAELRRAQEKIRDLERQLASRPSGNYPAPYGGTAGTPTPGPNAAAPETGTPALGPATPAPGPEGQIGRAHV